MTTAEQAASREPPGGQTWAQDAVDAAGGLDLLTDAALGVMHRLRPDSSLLRLAGELAGRPGLVGRQAARLGRELGRKGYPIRGAAPGTYVHDQ